MYLPYVRGKQFELLALKELAVDLASSGHIQPIIEPVREKADSLARCLDEFALFDLQSTVVLNPSVGDLANQRDAHVHVIEALADLVTDWSHVRLGIIVGASTDSTAIAHALSNSELREQPIDLIHSEYTGDTGLAQLVGEQSLQVVSSKEVVRRYRPRLAGSEVKIADRFPRRRTNLEYVGVEPSLFTDDNLYFQEDNFAGFSDFATIGEEFTDGGSSPRAVVIHLTYPDAADGSIWVRHFCSDSNDDTADVAGKFGEAVAKLVEFTQAVGLRNTAIDAFGRYAQQGAYPGLGTVKKLSIQNHLHVMMRALEAP